MTRETTIVLDTNVVLDWLVFANPAVLPLAQAIESGRFRWLANAAMRAELAHVVNYPAFTVWRLDQSRLWATWDRLAHLPAAVPALTGEALRLRCTDPDDQKFVDLALASSQWLISRDRAVLKLARRATRLGVKVVTPEQWSATRGD